MAGSNNLCIFIHFGEYDFIPRYVRIYLQELTLHFDEILFISNDRPITSGLDSLPPKTEVMWVPNEGYDLGMFYKAFQTLDLGKIRQIACINDSNVLFDELKSVFDWGRDNKLDFWGIIDSYQKPWFSTHADNFHLQSHFLVFEEEAIKKLPLFFQSLDLTRLFQQTNQKLLRQHTIDQWEIGLSQFLIKEGLSVGSFVATKDFSARHHLKSNANLSHKYYSKLMEEGYPLMKKKVLGKRHWSSLLNGRRGHWEKLLLEHGNTQWEIKEMIEELKELIDR